MDCGECLERLYPYLDHELSEEEVVVVKQHLSECTGCADHFYFEERFLERVRVVYAGDRAPEHLRRTIILRLRQS